MTPRKPQQINTNSTKKLPPHRGHIAARHATQQREHEPGKIPKHYGEDILRLMDEVAVRKSTTMLEMEDGTEEPHQTIIAQDKTTETWGVITGTSSDGKNYKIRYSETGETELRGIMQAAQKDIRKLSDKEIETKRKKTPSTNQFDGDDMNVNKGNATRLYFQHADGLSEQALNTEWGGVMEEYKVDGAFLTDTRTTKATNADVAKYGITRLFKDTCVKHCPMKMAGVGGCTRVLKQGLQKRVGNPKIGGKATFEDETGGLCMAVKFMGKKKHGVTPTVLIISICTPLPGSTSKKGLFEQLQEKLGKDPIKEMIRNVSNLLKKEAGPGTMVIITGDFNIHMAGPLTTTQKANGRDDYKALWMKEVIHPFNLKNVYATRHSEPTTTYRIASGGSWIDHTYASARAVDSEDPYITGIGIGNQWEKTEENQGLLNSCHLPTIMDVQMERWMNLEWNNEEPETDRFTPTLSSTNKKTKERYREALEEISTIKIDEKTEITVEQALEEMERNIEKAREESNATDIPDRINKIAHAVQKEMVEIEQALVSDAMRRRRKKDNYRNIWTPEEANRAYQLTQVKRVIGLARKRKWNPQEIWNRLTPEMIRILSQQQLSIPRKANTEVWEEWKRKAKKTITKMQREQHTRERKLANKKRKTFSTKLEEKRQLRLTRKYIDVALKRNNTKKLPTYLTHEVNGETIILDNGEEIKEVLTEITEGELGKGKTRWHTGPGGKNTDHPMTRENEEGERTRKTMAYGKEEERNTIKDTVAPQFHDAMDEMQMKKGAIRRPNGHYLTLITRQKWISKIMAKKSGTRPGPGNLTIDMLKSATENFLQLTRAIANTSIAHRMPMDDWTHSWCYKLPKTEGTPKATKLRPLRFLNVLRKITLACVKDNMIRDWTEMKILPKDQYAFLPNKSTIPAALMRRMLLEDAMANNKQLYSLDIDLSGGYDRIQRWVLRSALMRFGVDDGTIEYILNMAKLCTIGVLTAYGEGESFAPEAGALAQGDDTSCALWVCLTDWWLQTMERKNTHPYKYETGPNETRDMFACIYADDGTWVQTDRVAAEKCMQAANDFCEFTGQEISAGKSHALAIEWAGKKKYPTPATPIQIKQWRARGNAKNDTETTKEKSAPKCENSEQWTLYLDETSEVEWKSTKEHIRHLGNTQSAEGGHEEMLRKMKEDMREAARTLGRKIVKATGAEQIARIVLTPKMKYQMVLSNTNEAEIKQVQTILKNQLCRKFILCRTTRNAALWGNINGMGWHKWWNVVNIERAKILASALTTPETTIHHLMKGAIYRLQRSAGETGDIMQTLAPIHNKEKRIGKEWAFQLYEWMRENKVRIRSTQQEEQPRRKHDQKLVELAENDREASILCRHAQHANKLSDIINEDGETLTIGSPMAEDKDWTELIRGKLKVRRNKMGLEKLGEWETMTKAQCAQHEQRAGWVADNEGNLWKLEQDGKSTRYELVRGNSYTRKQQQTSTEKVSQKICKVRKQHKVTKKSNNCGYAGIIERTCTATPCLEKYKNYHPKTEEDEGDEADITGWNRQRNNQISFTVVWRKEGMQLNYSKVYIDNAIKEEKEETIKKTENLTKCKTCHAAICTEHTKEEKEIDGWTTTTETTSRAQYGSILCGECTTQATEKQIKDETVELIHTMEERTSTETQHVNPQIRPYTWKKDHLNQHRRIEIAKGGTEPTCRIYSDGSAKHNEGSYGWIAEVQIRNKWQEIARGGGVEKKNANPLRKISSSRMEALGVLRAKQHILRIWKEKIEIRLDNLTVVKRHNRMWQQQQKRWNDTDNDIWDQMRQTKTPQAKTIHVKGHQDTKKKGEKLDEHEVKNVVADDITGKMYKKMRALEKEGSEGDYYERSEATRRQIRTGECSIDGQPILGDNSKTIMSHLGTQEALKHWMKNWEIYSATHCKEREIQEIDTEIMRSIQKQEMHMPAIATYTKILHGVLATNYILTKRGDKEQKSSKCACCERDQDETNHHMLAECENEELSKIRKEMIKKLHKIIDNTLRQGKEKVPINPTVTKALCAIWNEDTIKQGLSADSAKPLPGNPNMEHVWQHVTDSRTTECLKDITKPGARMMWSATFTRNWTTNLVEMGINEATALKLARKIRRAIMENTAEIWRTRSAVKHDEKDKEKLKKEMEEIAAKAQELNIIKDAVKSIENALQTHKKEKQKRKWIKDMKKRIKDNKRDKENAQRRYFRRVMLNLAERKTPKDPEGEESEEEEEIHITKKHKSKGQKQLEEEEDTDTEEDEPTGLANNKESDTESEEDEEDRGEKRRNTTRTEEEDERPNKHRNMGQRQQEEKVDAKEDQGNEKKQRRVQTNEEKEKVIKDEERIHTKEKEAKDQNENKRRRMSPLGGGAAAQGEGRARPGGSGEGSGKRKQEETDIEKDKESKTKKGKGKNKKKTPTYSQPTMEMMFKEKGKEGDEAARTQSKNYDPDD